MSFWQHWQRGLLICIAVGGAGVAAMLAFLLPTGLVFLILEAVWRQPDWSGIEEKYFEMAAVIGIALLGPKFLSDMVEQGVLPPDWPPNRRADD